MKTIAAILVDTGKPLELGELEIPVLKPGQVLVEIAYSGACHTQVLEARGHRGEDTFLPHCLGHEGSGTVVDVGPGVRKVKQDDLVILSWIKGSGADVAGTVYSWKGHVVNAGGVTTFSRHAVVSENRLTPLPAEISLREAILLGCAAPTGFGAVFNVAKPDKGESLAVFGVGGIGLLALVAALARGCQPVIAIDKLEFKLDLARRIGATHCINVETQDVEGEIRMLCPAGVDHAIEATGDPRVMRQAFENVRPQGGSCVILGNARHEQSLVLDPRQFNVGKRLLGTWGGDSQPDRDYAVYADLIGSEHVDCDLILSRPYGLADINAALDDLEAGRIGRPVIDMALS